MLDSLVAETSLRNGDAFLQTKLGAFPNRPTMLAVKCDLIGINEFGTLLVCSIPGSTEDPITFAQNDIKWIPITRFGQIDQFRISIQTINDDPLP